MVDVRALRERGKLEAGDGVVMVPGGRRVQRVGIEWTPLPSGGGNVPGSCVQAAAGELAFSMIPAAMRG